MDQKIGPLTAEDEAHLKALEEWVAGHYGDQSAYESIGGKVVVIQQIIDQGFIEPSDPQLQVKRQALGASFGSALAQYYGLVWRMVEDEHGRDFALVVEGAPIRVFPLTMISKRLDNGEAVDVKALLADTAKELDSIKEKLAP